MATYKQLVSPNMGVRDGLGWCLRFTQSVFAAPVAYPSARSAWDGQKGRHFDYPPLGIAVPIWFDHWGNYGNPAFYKNWGHVATRLPDGRVLTSPFWPKTYGYDIFPNIQAMMRALGGNAKYLGWSEYMNGKQVVSLSNTPTPQPPPPGQEEDEDMARYIGSYIGGDKTTPAEKRSCVIYEPTSGFYTTWSGVNQAYTNDQARVFGTGNFSHITQRHWEQTILPQLLIQQKKGS